MEVDGLWEIRGPLSGLEVDDKGTEEDNRDG